MSDYERPRYSYEVAEVMGKRLGTLLEGLNQENAMAVMEELIDDYTHAIFGVGVIDGLRSVKMPGKGQSQCIQTLAGGRAVLFSSYGFKVKSDTNCRCGRAFLILDEMKEKDMEQEREEMGG